MRSLDNKRKYNKDKIREIIGPNNNVRDIINFFDNIFDQIIIVDNISFVNYMIGNDIYLQDQKDGYLWVNYHKLWAVLSDQYSFVYRQIQGLIRIWMEITYKLGSLTPLFANFVAYMG
jgi:hypothetical protein